MTKLSEYINSYWDGEAFVVEYDPKHIRVIDDGDGTVEFMR